MKEHLLQVIAIGLMVLPVGADSAEPEADRGSEMHHRHGGMMHGGPDMSRIVEHMSRRLELEDGQELAIQNIVDAAKPEAEALHEQARSIREALHELDVADADYAAQLQNLATRRGDLVTQMTLLHGRIMAEVSEQLTDQQRAKLSKALHGKRERFRNHHRAGESTDNTTS